MKTVLSLLLALPLNILAQVTADTIAVHNLDEVSVVAADYIRSVDKDTYIISAEKAATMPNVIRMLGTFRGVVYNNLNNEITLFNTDKFVYLVNGKEKNREHVNTYPPTEVLRVEIIRNVDAKFAVRGIRYAINIITKPTDGIIGSASALMIYSPNNNGNDDIVNLQPRVGVIYSNKKATWNVGGGYADIRWNYPIENTFVSNSGETFISNVATTRNPTEQNKSKSINAYTGFDYDFNINHSVTFNSNFLYIDKDITSDFSYTNSVTNAKFRELNDNINFNTDLRMAMAYAGKFSKGWSIDADVSYNYLKDNVIYDYDNSFTTALNKYVKSKNYLFSQTVFKKEMNNNLDVNFGTSFIYNKYKVNGMNGNIQSISSTRTKVFGFFNWHITPVLTINSGVSAIYVDQNKSALVISPDITLGYFNEESPISTSINYVVEPNYPMISQLSIAEYQKNVLARQIGNPALNVISYDHNITGSVALFDDLLSFTQILSVSPNDVDIVYMNNSTNIVSTFVNTNLLRSISAVELSLPLSKQVSFTSSVQYNYFRRKYETLRNSTNTITANSSISYFNKSFGLFAEITYARNQIRLPFVQGYTDYGQDLWILSANKKLLSGRMNVSLDYILPLKFGCRQNQVTVIDTPIYKNKQTLNLNTYKNLFLLRVSYNLQKGKRMGKRKDNAVYDNEQLRDRGLK